MAQKEVELSIRRVVVKEIKFSDMADIDGVDKKSALKKIVNLSCDITDEEYENLSVKDGILLTKEINELNGFAVSGFQKL